MTPTHRDAPGCEESVSLPTWQSLSATLAPFWAPGLALLCAGLAFLATRFVPLLSGRAGVWAPYVALGTLFPLVATVGMARMHRGWQPPRLLYGTLIMLPLLSSALLAGPIGAVIASGLAGGQTFICLAIISRHELVSMARAGGMFTVGFVAWSVMLQMFTWDPLSAVLPPSWLLLMVGALGVVACCWWAFGQGQYRAGNLRTASRSINLVATLVLGLLAFRTDGLFTTDRLGADGTFYHWGVLVGPAESVRQGGWLLWDTSSPYGFLSTLTLAAFPAATAWQSLYVLNAIMSFALAAWVYREVRANRPGLLRFLFALGVSSTVVFLVSTYPPTLTPEHYYPMSGAFRYSWCFVLIAVLLLERAVTPGSRQHTLVLALGCACWLLAMLWSAEIAVYSSVIWLPAFILITLRDHASPARRWNWPAIVAWLAIPPVLLAVAIAVIVQTFRQALGHGPDGIMYIDSVRTFTSSRAGEVSGLFAATRTPATIAAALLGFLLLAVVAVSMPRTREGWRDLPVVLALAFGVWALASYPVGLPLQFTVYRLMPFLTLALAIVQARIVPNFPGQPALPWIDLVRVGSVTLLASLLTTVFANGDELRYYASAISTEGYHTRDVTAGLPHVEPALERLMQQAGVTATDPIYYAGGTWGDMMPVWRPETGADQVVVSRQWLAGPLSTLAFRQDDLKQRLLQRAGNRQHQGGWLIQRRGQPDLVYTVGPWFFSAVQPEFIPARIAANADWQLVWYEPVADWPAQYGTRTPPATAPMLPLDLVVPGMSPTATVFPAAWGYFGPEWFSTTKGRAWRCAPGRGSIGIFTPSAQTTDVSFRFESGASSPLVSLNNGPASPVKAKGNRAEVRLALQPGWNTVVIARKDAGDTTPASPPTNPCADESGAELPLQIDAIVLRFTRDALAP